MNVSIQWYDERGRHRGTEQTTLSEVDMRCAHAHCTFHAGRRGPQLANPTLLRVLRFATGEVARVFKA